jgi:hypothetical protein
MAQACGTLVRDQTFYKTAPDRKKRLVVATVGWKPVLRVFLEEGSFRSRTLTTGMGEWYIGFLHMYWSPDSKVCGFWLVAVGSDNGILQAFDANSGKKIDSSSIRDDIRAAIVRTYKLQDRVRGSPAFDPFAWSSTQEAQLTFRTDQLE